MYASSATTLSDYHIALILVGATWIITRELLFDQQLQLHLQLYNVQSGELAGKVMLTGNSPVGLELPLKTIAVQLFSQIKP